jgi:chromatin segregation and condensation protein Rec8/ScpA/Scc1 (kleisin family)
MLLVASGAALAQPQPPAAAPSGRAESPRQATPAQAAMPLSPGTQIITLEQAERLLAILEQRGVGQWASFSDLVVDCTEPIQIVGRFLALLELYRSRAVAFDQPEALGVLQISWTGNRLVNEEMVRAEWDEAEGE